jgi:hypothetical protein
MSDGLKSAKRHERHVYDPIQAFHHFPGCPLVSDSVAVTFVTWTGHSE